MPVARQWFANVALLLGVTLHAQTAVTTSGGTTGSLPAFTGAATLGSSPVFTSNGNIGIGTTAPASLFSIGSGSPFQVTSSGQLNSTAGISVTNYQGNTALVSPGAQSTLIFQPNLTSALALSGFASSNFFGMAQTGTSSNSSQYLGVQSNHLKQTTDTGSQTNAYVQTNLFEVGGGSTSYGTVMVSDASANLSTTSSNVTNLMLFHGAQSWAGGNYTGTLTNLYGLYLGPMTGATNNYAIYSAGGTNYFAGKVGVGTSNPLSLFSVGSSSQFQVGATGAVTASSVTASDTVTASSFSGSGLTGIPYSAISGAPVTAVSSVFGRTGTVAAQSGDYTVNQITGAAPLASPAFSGNVGIGTFGFASSYRGSANNYTNLFLGGSIIDNGAGSYTVQTDGGSNYFAAIRMDNSGGNAGAINFYSAHAVSGSTYTLTNAQLASYLKMTIVGGNVGIGTPTPGAALEVTGNVLLTAGKGGSVTYQDGTTQSTAWNGILSGGDYAESVDVIGDRVDYAPGDVLVIDPNSKGRFMKSTAAYSTAVMGIYSTRPGAVGRRQKSDRSHMKDEVPMAMIGVVPTTVSAESGAIKPGDLLVTSSTPGFAMKGTDRSLLMGAIIGKALEPLDTGTGVIEVAVSIQ